MTIRVLIADDQMMVREGFSVLLNAMPDIEVAGEAVNGREDLVRRACDSCHPVNNCSLDLKSRAAR